MRPLLFLTLCKTKNKLLELLHKPVKLIFTLLFLFLLVMNFTLSENSLSGERNLSEFKAIIFAFYIVCFVTESKKGFHSGGTMFSMADVNLLFMTPLKSAAILFHGMLSRLGSSLFMALAFVYQFSLLRSLYPITAGDMLIAVAGYAAVVFLSQLTGMLIYFYTCGNSAKIKKAKAIFYSLCAVFALFCVIRIFSSQLISLESAALAFTSLPMRFFPVAGWVLSFVDGIMLSDSIGFFAGIIPSVLFPCVAFMLIAFSDKGYYEDVLLSVEKGGDVKADEGASKEIKIKSSTDLLKKGKGASVLFYKHLLENKRSKSSFFTPTSLIYLVLLGVYGFVFNGDFAMLFSFSCMVSFIPVLSGRWLKELTMPHIFMIPEPPFKKLFYILPEMLSKLVVESVLQCALISYICDLTATAFLSVTLSRLSVSFVLIGSALLAARIFREKEKNNIFLSLSVFPGIILTLPSVALCITALNFGFGIHIAFALMTAVNVILFLVLLFFSRNILKISE